MAEYGKYLSALMLFALFGFLLLYIPVQLANNYGKNTDFLNGSLNYDSFRQTITDVDNNSQDYRESFESGNVNDVDNPSGIFSVAKNMVSFVITPFLLLAQIMNNVFGVPTEVTTVILALLSISILFAMWRLFRIGN